MIYGDPLHGFGTSEIAFVGITISITVRFERDDDAEDSEAVAEVDEEDREGEEQHNKEVRKEEAYL